MRLHLVRHTFHRAWTMGTLYVEYTPHCFTLEDPDRLAVGLPKLAGVTAIPTGDYAVSITYSNKFRKDMPLIHEVPGFTGIRIHKGSIAAHTAGCPLVGKRSELGYLSECAQAYDPLFEELKKENEPSVITVMRIEFAQPILDRLKNEWTDDEWTHDDTA